MICATVTPDYFNMPSTACIISDKLGINNVQAFDISAACSGFVYVLSVAKAFIESGMKKNVLIIGSSTGYGLASRITAAFGNNAKTLGMF